MKHFDNFQEYRKDIFERVGVFDRTFKPWKKWQDVRLMSVSPCRDCHIPIKITDNCHYYQMCYGAEEELIKKCNTCPERLMWLIDVIEKLKWYEEQDTRLKD